MVMSLKPRVVKKITAMNPVARAFANQRLRRSMVDVKIKLYLTSEGEQIQSIVQEISRLLVTTILACRISNVLDHRVLMDAALAKLCAISDDDFRWRKESMCLVDDAMDAILLITPQTKRGCHTGGYQRDIDP